MPEEKTTGKGLEGVLDQLADYTLNTHNYQTIQNALDAEDTVKAPAVEKLLSICIRGLREDMKHTVNNLNVILAVINKANAGKCSPSPDLRPSALAVLHILKTTALFSKVEALKILCFDVIMAYPNETLIALVVHENTEFMELFSSYCHQRVPIDIRLKPIYLLSKLLKILPPDKRSLFVKHGVSIWFSKIVPTIMLYINTQNAKVDVPIEALEMLTEELVNIDYTDNPQWEIVLECIYTPERYPAILRNLLETDKSVWCRLWIVFIRLLKNQITKVSTSVGSPINSMLPIVELAFKMDTNNRCRAFMCWNVLIDNFSKETSDVYINKRMKLLMIPLTSNNAKVIETALAKLQTWWHLIIKFNPKQISEIALMPFLNFCFGIPNTSKLIPGKFSDEIKYKCVEVAVEIFGHRDKCNGTVSVSKLKAPLITTNLLVKHWNQWMHSVDNVIRTSAQNGSDEFKSHVECVWFSFITTIGQLTEAKLKRDFYYEVISYLDKLSLDTDSKVADMILTILIPTLFVEDERISTLLKSQDEQSKFIQQIISFLLRLPEAVLSVSRENINTLRQMTDYILTTPDSLLIIEKLLNSLPCKGLLLWTALVESICNHKTDVSSTLMSKILLWPLGLDSIKHVHETTSAWLDIYNSMYSKCTNANGEILKVLLSYKDNKLANDFVFKISIAMLRQKLNKPEGNSGDEFKLLLKVTDVLDASANGDENIGNIIKVVVEVLNVSDVTTTENALKLSKNVLQQCVNSKNLNECNVIKHLEDLFKSINLKIKKDEASVKKLKTVDDIKELGTKLLSIYESSLKTQKNGNSISNFKKLIKELCSDTSDETSKNTDVSNRKESVGFTEPQVKTVAKRGRKKEATIVNTVVDDGEEYVVVKSNWKFNPRKLTDNQKEKLQKKREDIPALYQDLSQSQDEFKLAAWKPDSQDTSSTSKSTSVSANDDLASIIKNIPNSDIVPKILKNIQPSNENIENNNTKSNKDIKRDDSTDKKETTPSAKDVKSPRMAIKDRVFKNVRILIEKSNMPAGDKSSNTEGSENEPKTPTSNKKTDINDLINSAPSKPGAERPSRLKRKPKKFENSDIFSLKKRRHSATENDFPENIFSKNDEIQKEPSNTEEIINIGEITENSEANQNIPPNSETIETCESQNNNDTNVAASQPVLDTVQSQNQDKSSDNINNSNLTDDPTITLNYSVSKDDTGVESTPKTNKKTEPPKSSNKKKKSLIEKQLAIDMVEGHPLLNVSTEKRLTRKSISSQTSTRKSATDKRTKNKQETKKNDKKSKDNDESQVVSESAINIEDVPMSQDIIESSQESSITTISLKSTKSISRKLSTTNEEGLRPNVSVLETQYLLDDDDEPQMMEEGKDKDDTELPRNKTVVEEQDDVQDLTEEMDTEPVNQSITDIIVLDDKDDNEPNEIEEIINIDDNDTQNTANADTQSMDPNMLIDCDVAKPTKETIEETSEKTMECDNTTNNELNNDILSATPDDITQTMEEIEDTEQSKSSPFKDEAKRKTDFMNNTVEISPIKTLSPVPEKKSPSPDTSNDYVTIKLSTAVQSNGEPFESCDSPEVFTEDKLSPDKRNLSPPREPAPVTNTSPSSALSLKKNKPQVRQSGRAAQMLGLCVPNRLQNIIQSEKPPEVEERKSTPITSSARRNLRILYGSTAENNEAPDEAEDNENFLKLKRTLPSMDSSPAGPILKRKLAEITDDATVSPASKRKRVSFHDPPVSTTVCIKKYIEPSGVRSPQNSAIKRHERQLRSQMATKSPKRLDNLFKLDTVLTKTVESFTGAPTNAKTTVDPEINTQETPVVEAEKAKEVNDTDPICSELIDCGDSIDNIASELSSTPIKEFEGKINTIGDFAKMTELEISRLCINEPKVELAKIVLSKYVNKIKEASEVNEITPTIEMEMESNVPEFSAKEMQTDEVLVDSVEVQTDVPVASVSTQSDALLTLTCSAQTDETGEKTVGAMIESCLLKKEQFVRNLCKATDKTFKQEIATDLSALDVADVLIKKLTKSNSTTIINKLLDEQNSSKHGDRRLLILKDYLREKFQSKDLILFCSDILRDAYDKYT